MSEWISVKDRLPEPLERVLVYYESGYLGIEFLSYYGTFIYEKYHGKVTHWMPLSEPPEEKL